MEEQASREIDPASASPRCQLTELNNRSRWYSSELWHIPFAYLGVSGVVIIQLAEKTPSYLAIGFAASPAFGIFALLHGFRIRASEQRAITDLQETERALRLPVTAQTHLRRPKIFQMALIIAVVSYAAAAVYLLFA